MRRSRVTCVAAAATWTAKALRVYVGHLRRKLGDDAADPALILTHFGLGVRWITARTATADAVAGVSRCAVGTLPRWRNGAAPTVDRGTRAGSRARRRTGRRVPETLVTPALGVGAVVPRSGGGGRLAGGWKRCGSRAGGSGRSRGSEAGTHAKGSGTPPRGERGFGPHGRPDEESGRRARPKPARARRARRKAAATVGAPRGRRASPHPSGPRTRRPAPAPAPAKRRRRRRGPADVERRDPAPRRSQRRPLLPPSSWTPPTRSPTGASRDALRLLRPLRDDPRLAERPRAGGAVPVPARQLRRCGEGARGVCRALGRGRPEAPCSWTATGHSGGGEGRRDVAGPRHGVSVGGVGGRGPHRARRCAGRPGPPRRGAARASAAGCQGSATPRSTTSGSGTRSPISRTVPATTPRPRPLRPRARADPGYADVADASPRSAEPGSTAAPRPGHRRGRNGSPRPAMSVTPPE